jgi:hypothetical protein
MQQFAIGPVDQQDSVARRVGDGVDGSHQRGDLPPNRDRFGSVVPVLEGVSVTFRGPG